MFNIFRTFCRRIILNEKSHLNKKSIRISPVGRDEATISFVDKLTKVNFAKFMKTTFESSEYIVDWESLIYLVYPNQLVTTGVSIDLMLFLPKDIKEADFYYNLFIKTKNIKPWFVVTDDYLVKQYISQKYKVKTFSRNLERENLLRDIKKVMDSSNPSVLLKRRLGPEKNLRIETDTKSDGNTLSPISFSIFSNSKKATDSPKHSALWVRRGYIKKLSIKIYEEASATRIHL
jgi:hypothetical protein